MKMECGVENINVLKSQLYYFVYYFEDWTTCFNGQRLSFLLTDIHLKDRED